MGIVNEEMNMIHKINSNVFLGVTKGEIRKCKCGTLMVWDVDGFRCPDCGDLK